MTLDKYLPTPIKKKKLLKPFLRKSQKTKSLSLPLFRFQPKACCTASSLSSLSFEFPSSQTCEK